MCGEHDSSIKVAYQSEGSSPHVRGARLGRIDRGRYTGIIPACAGSTRVFVLRRVVPRDHPRMCGEHGNVSKQMQDAMGSSPHVRGAQNVIILVDRVGGIIPACAGSTNTSLTCGSATGDHPRMCGEHNRDRRRLRHKPGSSPHVRGAPVSCLLHHSSWGIIPACAGSTLRK